MISEKYRIRSTTNGSLFLGVASFPSGCSILHQAKPDASALPLISSHRRAKTLSNELEDQFDLKRSLYLFRRDGEAIAVIAGGISRPLSLMSAFRFFP